MGEGERVQVIDLSPRGPVAPPGAPRRRAALLVLGLVGVVAALAATLLLVPGGDAEVAVEEEEPTTTTEPRRRESGDAGTFPAPLALGAPDDGKESVGLPVKAEPSTGLVDGQSVVVTGTGFPPGESVGVVMCTKEAGRDHGARGAEACNLGRFSQVTSDADGVATVSFEVRRLVVLDGQEIDCASEAQRCLIGMGLISDYDQSGGVLVDFDPDQPLPDPPAVSLDGTGPHDDGDQVTVRVDGLYPGTGVGAAVCTHDGGFCADAAVNGVVGSDGSAAFDLRLWRAFAGPVWDVATAGRDIDCAVVECRLQIWGEAPGGRAIPEVPLSFTDRPLERARPVVEVRSSGPYRPGDRIEAFVSDVPHGAGAEAVLCGPDHCSGGMLDIDWSDGGIELALVVPSAEEGNPCVGGTCVLAVHVYGVPEAGAAPSLAPAPVEVAVEP